jgi:hypothetical protein
MSALKRDQKVQQQQQQHGKERNISIKIHNSDIWLLS